MFPATAAFLAPTTLLLPSTPRPTHVAHTSRRPIHMTVAPAPSDKPPVPIPPQLRPLHVLGLGMTGVDILANLDRFPKPDEKIRTQGVSVMGGGNTANALTALRRLGVRSTYVSKVGDDLYGKAALAELQADGIDVQHIVCKKGLTTSFVYVLVDKQQGTRTCLATICDEDLFPSDVHEHMLDGVQLLALDGRHTLAAIQLAKYARKRAIPILIDVERERPHIRDLLPFADYIVTNSAYPFIFAPNAPHRVDALQSILETFDAKFVISTLGAEGSIMVHRQNNRERGHDLPLAVHASLAQSPSYTYEVLQCPVWSVNNIVDTTGAGDAFIGAVLYSLVTNLDYETMLCLASRVAAAKIEDIGSRTGLPRREELAPALLSKPNKKASVSRHL